MALRLVLGLDPPVRFDLSEGRRVAGAGEDCEITLNHPSISRRHAAFEVEGGELRVEDLGSLNGTWIGSRRLNAGRRTSGSA